MVTVWKGVDCFAMLRFAIVSNNSVQNYMKFSIKVLLS